MQIAAKLENQEIPKTVRYVVIADPPGPTRIGTGGATFHIMQVFDPAPLTFESLIVKPNFNFSVHLRKYLRGENVFQKNMDHACR